MSLFRQSEATAFVILRLLEQNMKHHTVNEHE